MVRGVLCAWILFYCCLANAADPKLSIAVGWTKPPYVISAGDTGYELDLITAVLDSMGYQAEFVYVPYGRSHALLKQGKVDITLTLSARVGIDQDMLSDVYVIYQNVAISLKRKSLSVKQISGLEKFSIIAFQEASKLLGDEFDLVSKNAFSYTELPNQYQQVQMLLMESTDMVVMDINIFLHVSRQLTGKVQIANVKVHELFPLSPYRAGFKDKALKNTFNQALHTYLRSEQHLALTQKYEFYQPNRVLNTFSLGE